MKITTIADVPDELAQEWLQHLRTFDAAHPGCHFVVRAHAPDMSTRDMMKALEVDPPFDHTEVKQRTP